jgi:hypothetical protein
MEDKIAVMRGFRGKPSIVFVCGANRRVVLVTGKDNYDKLVSGQVAANPIGVPRADVFRYNQTTFQQLLDHWQDDGDVWDRVTLWENSLDEAE